MMGLGKSGATFVNWVLKPMLETVWTWFQLVMMYLGVMVVNL